MAPGGRGERAVADEDDECQQHEHPRQPQHDERRRGRSGWHELRQESQEEQRQLRVQDVQEDTVAHDPAGRSRGALAFDLQRAALAQHTPGHVQQVADAQVLDDHERHGAGVQQRGQTGDAGGDVRDDPERTADRRPDAGAPASPESAGQRVQNAGARQQDDDHRRDQEFGGHGGILTLGSLGPCRAMPGNGLLGLGRGGTPSPARLSYHTFPPKRRLFAREAM